LARGPAILILPVSRTPFYVTVFKENNYPVFHLILTHPNCFKKRYIDIKLVYAITVEIDYFLDEVEDYDTAMGLVEKLEDICDTEEYNLDLSQKRAQSVVQYLIEKGVEPDRLSPKGYGESSPKVVDSSITAQYSFLKTGTALSEQYINSLANDEQREIAHQINRRTEFRVLRTDYEAPKK
jgi:hypothetical protein